MQSVTIYTFHFQVDLLVFWKVGTLLADYLYYFGIWMNSLKQKGKLTSMIYFAIVNARIKVCLHFKYLALCQWWRVKKW